MLEFCWNMFLESILMGKLNEQDQAEEAEVDEQSVVILTRVCTLYTPVQTDLWLQATLHLEWDMTLGKAVFSIV